MFAGVLQSHSAIPRGRTLARLGLLTCALAVTMAFSFGSAPKAEAHWAAVGTWANTPIQGGGSAWVWGRGALSTSHVFFIQVYLQRRACGFWGCSWQNKGHHDAATAWGNNLTKGGWVGLDSGCHDYRTKTVVGVRHAWDTGYTSHVSPTIRMCR